MSTVGYYRYKAVFNSDSDVNLYINQEIVATKSVKVRPVCDEFKIIKYLNKDGQYRFFNFNRFWESRDKPREIGRANKIITSLLDTQSSSSSIGYKNDKTITVYADDVSQEELILLVDLWTSPRVYLYMGDGTTYDISDWVEVSIKSKDNLNRIKKGGYQDLFMDIILPEHYTINML